MMRIAVLVGLLGLAACSTSAPPAPAPPPAAPAPASPVVAPQPVADTCGARDLQSLVGRPRTEIPVPVRPELQRVACTTCAITMDVNLNRLNVFFDAATGLIKEVRCG